METFECTRTNTSQWSLTCARINTRDQRLIVLRRTADFTNFFGTIKPKRGCGPSEGNACRAKAPSRRRCREPSSALKSLALRMQDIKPLDADVPWRGEHE